MNDLFLLRIVLPEDPAGLIGPSEYRFPLASKRSISPAASINNTEQKKEPVILERGDKRVVHAPTSSSASAVRHASRDYKERSQTFSVPSNDIFGD